jgi:N-acetylmuramoyl-L-alanine amidase
VKPLGAGRYISTTQFNALLRKVQPDAFIDPDATTGVYHAKVLGNDFKLYRDESSILINNGKIDTPDRLYPTQGQVFVPLSSVERVLANFEGVTSNVHDLVQLTPTPAPTVAPRASAAVRPAPGAVVPPLLPAGSPGSAAPRETAGEASGVDTAALAETLRLLTGGQKAAAAPRDLTRSLRNAATTLLPRRTVVLDPEPNPRAVGEGAGDVPDLTLQVAQQCRQLLAPHAASLSVVLTRSSGATAGTLDERLNAINTAGSKALICLRIDWSEFPENCGYRIYAMHEAIDPEALQWRGAPDAAPGPTQPQHLTYLPFENVGLVLARLVQGQLDKSGQTGAPDPLVLAPHYLLRRAAMPAVTLSLGSWTCDADRARLTQAEYTGAVAASLAESLLRYNDWLGSMAGGGR